MRPHSTPPRRPRFSLGTLMILVAATAMDFAMDFAFVKREGPTPFTGSLACSWSS
jgi:hypothetical protein